MLSWKGPMGIIKSNSAGLSQVMRHKKYRGLIIYSILFSVSPLSNSLHSFFFFFCLSWSLDVMLSLIRFSRCNSHLAHILAILNTSAPSGKTILFASTLHFLSFKQIFIQGKTLLLTLPDLLQRFAWSLLKNQGCVMSPHPHSCTSLQKMDVQKMDGLPPTKGNVCSSQTSCI